MRDYRQRVPREEDAYPSQRGTVLNRREFQLSLLKLSAAALAPRLLLGPHASAAPDIAALYQSAIVVDSLCSPFLDQVTAPDPALVAVVQRSGITAVNYTISDTTFEGTINNPGKLADLTLVSGDPVQNISDIRKTSLVVKNGVVYKPQELYSALGVAP
jgi:hypothetical protein